MEKEFENIVEKVSNLYQKYGIKSVTMDDVSRELGISKKTLYAYVANKEELVEKFIEYKTDQKRCNVKWIQEQKLNAIEELLAVNQQVVEMLKNFNPATEYDLKKYYPGLYTRLRKQRMDSMYKAVFSNIEKGKKEGFYRAELNGEIIAKIYVSRIENSFESEMFSMDELTSETFINEMMIYHIRGIANKKGIDFLEKKLLSNNS